MRIIVAVGICPFDNDEMDSLARHMAGALRADGHDVETVRLNAQVRDPFRVLDQATALQSLRFDHAEQLVAIGWPAVLLAHKRKSVLLTRRSVCGGWFGETSATNFDILVEQERRSLEDAHSRFALSTASARAAYAIHGCRLDILGLPHSPHRPAVPAFGMNRTIAVRYARDARARLPLAFAAVVRADPSTSLLLVGGKLQREAEMSCAALARDHGLEGRACCVSDLSVSGSAWHAALDVSEPGLACGLWLGEAIAANRPAVVVEGADAWDIARLMASSVQVSPTAEAIAAALRALPLSTTTAPGAGDLAEPDWTGMVAALLG